MIKDVGDFKMFLDNLEYIGFQATQLGRARALLKEMLSKKATLFLSFPSNIIASGLRGLIASFIRKGYVDVVITAGGAIDHDIAKCFVSYEAGSFDVDDVLLHERGINRLGNIFVPNEAYVKIEEISKQVIKDRVYSPSELIYAYAKWLSENCKDQNSFLIAAYEKNVPVFCPGIIDAAIGLDIYFLKQRYSKLAIDVTSDLKKLADIVLNAEKTAAIVIGGGISKHHTIAANILRDGLDYAIYITTAVEWDGSLSGARTREAISWGKISEQAKHITVYGDATLLFPLLIKDLV